MAQLEPSHAQRLTNELAAELRALRTRSGKSLRQLERPTFTSDSSLSRYLAGQSLPPWRVVEVLSEQGGGDPAELRPLWERASKARAQARTVDTEHRPQARDETALRIPVRWLVALAAISGLVGILISRRRALSA